MSNNFCALTISSSVPTICPLSKESYKLHSTDYKNGLTSMASSSLNKKTFVVHFCNHRFLHADPSLYMNNQLIRARK